MFCKSMDEIKTIQEINPDKLRTNHGHRTAVILLNINYIKELLSNYNRTQGHFFVNIATDKRLKRRFLSIYQVGRFAFFP
jgi:hypothetical protein